MADEKILVVDDEPGVRSALEAILTDEGFRVTSVGSGEQGLEALAAKAFDAVLLDVWLPGMDGLETLQKLRDRHDDVEVVMISGHGTIETAVRATRLGAFDFVEKPLSLEKTLLVLRNALRQRKLEQVNRRLLEQLERDTEIIGRSPAVESLRAQVDVAASSESPVLILGTAGSGRQHVARRIHRQGTRAERAFVVVPCGALDGPAVTLALYGDDQQRGRIELARGGTLLLEDVDRLPVEAQRRLAAALNEESRRPDGTRPLATSRPATESIEPELLQRLAVLRLELPRLVDRREDIGLLAERMLREISREYGREHPRFAKDALAALTAYGWPGETQELRNVVERIFLSTKGEVVTAADLPADLSGVRDVTEDLYRSFGSLDEGLAAFAAYYVRRVFSEVGDDETLAAERLGLTVDELRRKLDELAIRQG